MRLKRNAIAPVYGLVPEGISVRIRIFLIKYMRLREGLMLLRAHYEDVVFKYITCREDFAKERLC